MGSVYQKNLANYSNQLNYGANFNIEAKKIYFTPGFATHEIYSANFIKLGQSHNQCSPLP